MNSNRLSLIIKYLIYVLALSPLIITPFTFYPFTFGKGLIIQFLIEIIFGLYIVLAIFDKRYRPKKNILTILFGLFLVSLFISSVFGAYFSRSFWGDEARFTGWLYIFHTFLFFIVLVSLLKDKKAWKSFLSFNVFVALVAFGIAVLSLFDVQFWGVDMGKRIAGTLGNPLFLASYFILNLIFAIYLFINESNKKLKLFWFILVVVIVVGVLLTQSRGALLGLLGGIIIGLFIFILLNKNKKIRIVGITIIVMIIVAPLVLFFLLRVGDTSQRIENYFGRLVSVSGISTTGNTRLMNWEIASMAIVERPFFGWGVEGYRVAFNKYYNPKFLKYSYYETWSDKPHNKLLEVGVDGGTMAILLYLGIFGSAIFILKRKKDKGEISSVTLAVFCGGLSAYFLQNLFVFDTSTSYLVFSILLAFIASKHEDEVDDHKRKIPQFIFILAVLLSLAGGWALNIHPILAYIKYRNALPVLDVTKKTNIDLYKNADKYFNPYKGEAVIEFSKVIIGSLRRGDTQYSQDEIFYALEELKNYTEVYKNSAYNHMLLGGFYTELIAYNEKFIPLAEAELKKALDLSPQRQHIYFAYARFYAVMKDRNKLVEVSQKAIELEDTAALSYWEGGKQLYLFNKEDELAHEWIVASVDLGHIPEDEIEFYYVFHTTYSHFLEKNNYKILKEFYQRIQKIEPLEVKWYAQGAMAAYLDGDFRIALQDIESAIKLDDAYREEGEKFRQAILEEMKK